jgi:hypothetical protein
MKPTIGPLALILGGMLVLAGASGCADVKVRRSQNSQPAAYQAAPVDDGRAAGRVHEENASLRATMQDLEQRHSSLAASVEAQERRKDDLKRQRELVEKDRDRYKKLFNKDD